MRGAWAGGGGVEGVEVGGEDAGGLEGHFYCLFLFPSSRSWRWCWRVDLFAELVIKGVFERKRSK